MDRLTTIKAAACTAAAALTAFWGWTGWLAAAWFLAMLLDYATGSAAALRAGTWSSRAAREGLWHKAGSVAGVLVAALLDFALRVLLGSVPGLGIDYDVLLCPLVTAWYLLTELGSIAENAGALGAPMPQFLMRAIAPCAPAFPTAAAETGMEAARHDGLFPAEFPAAGAHRR